MNKLIIKNIGYNFHEENLEYLKSLTPKERLRVLYVLPNYSYLEKAREELVDSIGAINSSNILTFDDLASKFYKNENKIINANEGTWIIKKIVEKLKEDKISDSLGTSKEILSYILFLKSNEIDVKTYEQACKNYPELNGISKIYKMYDEFLKANNLEDEIGEYLISRDNILNFENSKKIEIIINGFIEFRPHEIKLLKALTEAGNKIVVQYPFNTHKNNIKIQKMIKEFEDLGFFIEKEDSFKSGNFLLAFNILSSNVNRYPINTVEISASTKYYEIREVFSNIRQKLEYTDIEEISIIAPEEYEEIIKTVSRETKIPISIMNERSGKDLSVIQFVLNFLELIKNEEKKKLISFVLDERLSKEFESNREFLLKNIREMNYKGISYEYLNLDDNLKSFFSRLREIINSIMENPYVELKDYLQLAEIEKDIIESFYEHKDVTILKDSLNGLDLLNETIDKVFNFSKMLNLKGVETVEILIEELKNSTFYSREVTKGIQVLRPINSIGNQSKNRFICGLGSDYPMVMRPTFLYSERFKSLFENLGINIEDRYENFDKSILVFSQSLAGAEKLIFSYSFEDSELSKSKSIFLKDSLKRIESENFNNISARSMVKDNETEFDTIRDKTIRDIFKNKNEDVIQLNYLLSEDVYRLNHVSKDYSKRKEGFEEFIGKLNRKMSLLNYSPKSLEYYRVCPFKFYVKYILEIEPLELEYVDEFHIDKGNYFHMILKSLYESEDVFSLEDGKLSDKVKFYVDKVIDSEDLTSDEKEIQKEIYYKFLINFVREDLSYHEKIQGKFRPVILEGHIYGKFDGFDIKGFVDRVDEDEEGNLLIIDYKSNYHPSGKDVRELKKIQLPIYSLIMNSEKVKGAIYGSIQKGKLQHGFISDTIAQKSTKYKFGEEELKEYFEQAKDLLVNIHEGIDRGDFQVDPIDLNECDYCEYQNICRKEEILNYDI